jgi:hypothetical protein
MAASRDSNFCTSASGNFTPSGGSKRLMGGMGGKVSAEWSNEAVRKTIARE